MTIAEARKTLGERGKKYTDKQVQDLINHLALIANIAIDSVVKMNDE
ncbi:MAG TPA: hypothetical protein VNW29_02000 [Candidatus Sulfotelmatobacter sp.]|jgi:hypothetical protein|nr:hypothetical protein [Candidatus Sulfotelmatobacter sp.]